MNCVADSAPQRRLATLLDDVISISYRAGREILALYGAEDARVVLKDDQSPLTMADLRAHEAIRQGLEALGSGFPVLSEESAVAPFEERRRWASYWLVDPLDGTKEFLSRNGEFTVNIALVCGHEPVLGVVFAPVLDLGYAGIMGMGAFKISKGGARQRITGAARAGNPVRVVGSRSHRDDVIDGYLEKLGAHELLPMGSSLKFCLVADGRADVYPRFGPTSEWDTAAGHAVASAAKCTVVTADGSPLRYNTKEHLLNPSFIVYADSSRNWLP